MIKKNDHEAKPVRLMVKLGLVGSVKAGAGGVRGEVEVDVTRGEDGLMGSQRSRRPARCGSSA
jgi:hypothetical protein